MRPILAGVQPTMMEVTNNGEQLVKNEENLEQLTEVEASTVEKHGIREKDAAPKTKTEVKKVVNIPVIRDKEIQVGTMGKNLLLDMEISVIHLLVLFYWLPEMLRHILGAFWEQRC